MEDVKTSLITLLKTLGYPVKLQGSITKNAAYPDSFFTIWNYQADDASHYDNEAISFAWGFTISFYSKSPALVNSMILSAKALLKQNKWIVGGKGYDVPSDEPTHTGRAIDALYLEIGG